jgi:uncharacterized protein YqjF (DUF2071 family)
VNLTDSVAHRPWPLPKTPWIQAQTWYDLLFAHWPIAADELRKLVPATLPLDLYEGQGWVGVVPFGIIARPRGVLPIPKLSYFPEINVRTYVTLNGKPGVYFFSLNVNNPLVVLGARLWYHLEYFEAQMYLRHSDEKIDYFSRTPADPPAEFKAQYWPTGEVMSPDPQSLDRWLTERYCLYAVDSQQRVYRAEIHHPQWPLQPAAANIDVNTMTQRHGFRLPEVAPLLHFARRIDVAIWQPSSAL